MSTPLRPQLREFRNHVLTALKQAQASQRQQGHHPHMHLLYTPELYDPLPEAADARRQVVHIRVPEYLRAVQPPKDSEPRLITLDTRLVAAYLLEQDPALDDPLLESSITQAHAEAVLGQRADAQIDNNEPELATAAVAGWIVGPETASQMARRIASHSAAVVAGSLQSRRQWVRWTQPQVLCGLWPHLSDKARASLLGPAHWVSLDAQGQVRSFHAAPSAEPDADPDADPPGQPAAAWLDAAQAALLRRLPLVHSLLPAWQQWAEDRGFALPDHAPARLHELLAHAEALRLPTRDVPAYVLAAAPLPAAALQAPAWQAMLQHLGELGDNGPPVAQHLLQLPAEFWAQWLGAQWRDAPPPRAPQAA